MPESLFPFLPLYTAQGTAEILCGIQELSPDAKQHKQLSHWLPFCTLLRKRRSKQEKREPVLCQGTETWQHQGKSEGCVNAAQTKEYNHRAGGHSQPGFKLITAVSVLAAQTLSQDPSKAAPVISDLSAHHCPRVPELPNF